MKKQILTSLAGAAAMFGLLGGIALAAPSTAPAAMAPSTAAVPPEAGKFILMVFNNPIAGKDAEFNVWYDHTHSGQVTSQLGFTSSRRFAADPVGSDGAPPRRYMIMYSGASSDLANSYAGYFVNSKKKTGAPAEPSMIEKTSNYNDSFQAIGPEVAGAGAAGKGAAQDYEWLVYASSVAGMDKQAGAWLKAKYVPAIARAHGVVGAQLYHRTVAQLGNATRVATPPYLIVYRLRTDDIGTVVKAMESRQAALKPNPAVDAKGWVSYGYRALGPDIRP